MTHSDEAAGRDGPRRRSGALRAGLLASSALVAATLPAAAQTVESATWYLNGTGDFNTAANWTPGAVPYAGAFFGTSNQTNVWFSASTFYFGDLIFNAGASDYTFTNTGTLYSVNSGIVVNGGSATINNSGSGTLTFITGQAGDATINNDGDLSFEHFASAGRATIVNNGVVTFLNSYYQMGGASAGSAKIENNRLLNFNDKSTAGSATITNRDGLFFNDYSTGGSATIVNDSLVFFWGLSSAGDATITNNSGGTLFFEHSGSGGNATIINNSGGTLIFHDNATGGTARLINDGTINLSTLTNGITAGSIEGGGIIHLGGKNLTVGGNNLSTTFFGTLDGIGGSLTKEGAGTLTLAGVNTYSGDTTVNAGTLLVNGSIASAATVNNGGTFGGGGTIFNNVTMNSGGTFAPGAPGLPGSLMTVTGDVTFGPDACRPIRPQPRSPK